MARLSLSLLGRFQATLDDRPVNGFESNKVRALLAYLVVESGHPYSRTGLAALLWPDRPEAAAHKNLNQALANLRRAIGDTTTQPPFLLITRDTLQFNPDSDYQLDVGVFTTLLAECERHIHRQADACRSCGQRRAAAVGWYHGNFLDQFWVSDSEPFEEWVLMQREQLQQLVLDALDCLAQYYERHGEHERALHCARRQLAIDAWREEAHRRAMRVLMLSGQRSAALAQYETCRRILAAELDAEPSAETKTLYEQIKAERFTVSTAIHSLPIASKLLIGRERELAEIDRLVTNPACHVVTLVGPGGVGKTQLALHAAAAQIGAFADGVYFISLAALASAVLLVATIAHALGFALNDASELLAQLVHHLVHKEMLIVLDNFEQLLSEGADLLAELIALTPQVVFIVTSRERLNLSAEWIVDVTGLSVPTSDHADHWSNYSAMQLFASCVERLHGQQALNIDDGPWVARICRLVAGLPLAIELVATWTRSRSYADIVREIERSLDFVAAPLRDLPERHRSLRAVFDHSWQLLSAVEREVMQALSIFRDGFDQAAAKYVVAATSMHLSALKDKSLLRSSDDERYDLHELIRQYAEEQLQSAGAGHRVRARHATYFLALAEEAEPHLVDASQARWLKRLALEHGNFQATLTWAQQTGPSTYDIALRLCAALWRFWWMHSHLTEGRYWLEQVLVVETQPELSTYRAKALHGAGVLAYYQNDYERANHWLLEGLALYRQLDDPRGMANMLNSLGVVAIYQSDYTRASELHAEALRLRRAASDQRGIAISLNNLGLVAHYQEDYTRAIRLFEQSIALFDEVSDERVKSAVLSNFGQSLLGLGDYQKAKSYLRDSIQVEAVLGNRADCIESLEAMGRAMATTDQVVRGVQLLGAVEALRESIQAPLPPISRRNYERDLTRFRAQLDPRSFATAWATGRTMSLQQAIELALAE